MLRCQLIPLTHSLVGSMTLKSFMKRAGLLTFAVLFLESAVASQRPESGEKFTPPARGERKPDVLKSGDPAPDFSLPDTKGKKEVCLSSFKGKKPVVLIFGSCT